MGNIDWKERDRKELAQRELLGQLAGPIADALGAGWYVAQSKKDGEGFSVKPNYVQLHGPDGAELGLSVGYPYDGKVSISAHFIDHHDGHQFWYLPYKTERPSINASLTRGSAKVAADIKRRLFSAYLPLLAACNDARAEYLARMERTSDTATIIGLLIGSPNVDKNRDGYSYNVRPYHSERLPGSTVDIRVLDGEVEFGSLRVDPFVAKEILKLLILHHPRREEAA